MSDKMNGYVAKLNQLSKSVQLSEASSPGNKMIADTITRLFLGDSDVALTALKTQIMSWKKANAISYNSTNDYNDDFDRLFKKVTKLIDRI